MAFSFAPPHAGLAMDEVPVGAVVVYEGAVVGAAHNQTLSLNDPTAHAEVLAIRAAAQTLGNHRLNKAELFVTLEPCLMCAGALLHARISRVVFGASDKRWGVCGSVTDVLDSPLLNHSAQCRRGVLAAECGVLLSDFFQQKRKKLPSIYS